MNYRELFKSKRFLFIFGFIIESSLFFILGQIIHFSDIFSNIGLLSVFILLFGPYVILGISVASGILNLILNFGLEGIFDGLFYFFISFVIGMLIWRLWYDINIKNHKVHTPKINSVFDIIKLIIICFLLGISNLVIPSLLLNLNNKTLTSIFVSNILPLMIILTIVPLANYYKIPMYSPRKQIKQILPKKLYEITLLLGFIIMIICSFVDFGKDMSFFISIIILFCIFIYILKPFDEKILKIKQDFRTTLNEKVISSVISIFLILVIFELIFLKTNMKLENEMLVIIMSIIININYVILLIPLTIYLNYIEKEITKPISKISQVAMKTHENTFNEIKNEFSKVKDKNEVGVLSESLTDLTSEIEKYSIYLKENITKKEKYETELKLAHEIQLSMLSTEFKEFNKDKNIDIFASMVPAKDVGGDFYDFFEIDEENIGISIGDVSGKGIPAALFMIRTMTLIRDYAHYYNNNLKTIFMKINDELCKNNHEELFVTCWTGKLNIKTGELTYVNAGHNQPIINNKKEIRYLDTKPGLVLAAMEGIQYKENTIKLEKEDFIVLFTDGVTEANDNYKEFYGEERLKNIVKIYKNESSEIMIDKIKKDINEFTNNKDSFDDTTILILKYK